MFAPEISYQENALEPILTVETIRFHFGKHHAGYCNTLNKLILNTEYQSLPLIEIIKKSRNKDTKIFNNASQIFNHNFYWKCLKINGAAPCGKLKTLIDEQFGNFETFLQKYVDHANTMFGSGWSWLVYDAGELKFINTANAENPISLNVIPLCVIDLWEHAYYIDYRNNRAEYIDKLIKSCINWDFCESLIK